jgi:hypothetical protein
MDAKIDSFVYQKANEISVKKHLTKLKKYAIIVGEIMSLFLLWLAVVIVLIVCG